MEESITLYGIANCDTVRKARRWLNAADVNYRFHDIRKDGLQRSQIEQWCQLGDWEQLLNRQSRTFRQLDEKTREQLNGSTVFDLMLQHPTMIKRPVLETGKTILVGFREQAYVDLFDQREL